MAGEKEVVDQCWFCKGWFFTRGLEKVAVMLESFSANTTDKMACFNCRSAMADKGAPAQK